MEDLNTSSLQIFIINGNENITRSIKFGKLSTTTFVESSLTFESSKDLFDTRSKISESDAVVAVVDEVFNNNNQFQYELAWTVQLQKPLIVLIDGTTLPSVFDCPCLCKEDVKVNPQWIEAVESSLLSLFSKEISTGNRERIQQFIWSIEETLILPSEEAADKTSVKSTDEFSRISSTRGRENSNEVSNTFLCSLLTSSQENIASKVNSIPPEIKKLCEKHQKMITKCHIRLIGRSLGLDNEHLEIVESYFEHGIQEMFWQLVKIWHDVSPDMVSARKMKRALRQCNIHTEETHMPTKHSQVLDEMTDFFVNNITDINHLIPFLISERVLCPVTRAYVTAPKTRDQKIVRLLEILSTRECGMSKFVNVLRKSGNDFLADAIICKLPELQILREKKPFLAVQPSPRSSCSSETSVKSITLRSAPSLDRQSLLTDYASENSLTQKKLRPISVRSAPPSLRLLPPSTVEDRRNILNNLDCDFDEVNSKRHETCCKCVIL